MKYDVTYTIESTDLNAATSWAHEMLYLANLEADSVKVQLHDALKSGRTFAQAGRVIQSGSATGRSHVADYEVWNNTPEVNPRVVNHVLPDGYTV